MNYYERHLGDYAKHTGHLSMLEHGAYTLLLDRYYSTETGIPADQAYKIARAAKKEERAAVDAVLSEFFTLTDNLWIKNRVEEEIERYIASIPAAEAKRENDKTRQRKARARRKKLFEEIESHGVVMPWNASISELNTELSRLKSQSGHDDVTQPVTRDNLASTRLPVSSLQSPSDSRRDEASPLGTLKTQIYRLAKQLGIAAGTVTTEIQAHSETDVWQALGSTLAAKPAEALPYFRACLKKAGADRFKTA
jgi:uncharacterized protein YdaU (DUF1376 family)